MQRKFTVALSGSITYDYLMSIGGRFREHTAMKEDGGMSMTLIATTLTKGFGGTAGNIAYTLRMLRGEPRLIGVVGSDSAPYFAHLKRYGISKKYIAIDSTKLTTSVYIVADAQGDQVSSYYSAVNQKLVPRFSDIKEKLDFAMVSPTEGVTMKRHIDECSKKGIPVIFDPGQWSTSLNQHDFRGMITKSTMLIANEYEIGVVIKHTGWSLAEIVAKLSVVIITKGALGSEIRTPEGITHVAACKPKVVRDPTGAGDAYRGGLLAGLSRGYALTESAQVGSVAASYCLEKAGTQEHSFTIPEFIARYKKCYQQMITL